jgi:tubulin polyglutamylase TTLL9
MKEQPEPYVVQRYIMEPLLIGGKKFDMRIYALCTSYAPLTIYLNRSGFGRFTHVRYDASDINNMEGHLTNVAIQKRSDNYDEERGGKWLLDKLRLYLTSKYGHERVDECFYNVQQIIIKTLSSVVKVMMNDKRCFELYGFDVLLDSNLRPWLLEVNGSPSMTANTPIDQ